MKEIVKLDMQFIVKIALRDVEDLREQRITMDLPKVTALTEITMSQPA
jgi:hypothetical protein